MWLDAAGVCRPLREAARQDGGRRRLACRTARGRQCRCAFRLWTLDWAPARSGSAMPPREQRVFVRASHVARGLSPGELPRALESAARAGRAQLGVADQACEGSRHAFTIVRFDIEPGISDNFGECAALRHDHRHAGGHRLERRYAEPFVEGWQDERLRALEERFALFGRNVAAILDMTCERRLDRCAASTLRRRRRRRPAITSRGAVGRRASSRP